jgi:hypothetical protein
MLQKFVKRMRFYKNKLNFSEEKQLQFKKVWQELKRPFNHFERQSKNTKKCIKLSKVSSRKCCKHLTRQIIK